MKKLVPATMLAVALGSSSSHAQQTFNKDALLGSWKVLSLKATSGDKVNLPLGDKVDGYVTITPSRIWLLFVDGARKTPAAPNLTDAEAIEMMKTQVAWTGKYTLGEQTSDGIKLTAHVDAASSQAIFNTDRVYFVRLNDNKITFTGKVVVPMTGATNTVVFDMMKSD
jgi:hypothetical protein